ncbi:MAG: helix-turn-helix domain-containing protein [Clostridiales bacterium]|nr:helix-turn-helix domain-containing protein [Clostridiales bacterium]
MLCGRDYWDFNAGSGGKVYEMRMRRHYTRDRLAEMAGISSKFLYDIEMGRSGCSSYVMYRLAEALDVSVDYLFDYGGDCGEQMEELCSHFHGSQKESMTSILRLIYKMME